MFKKKSRRRILEEKTLKRSSFKEKPKKVNRVVEKLESSRKYRQKELQSYRLDSMLKKDTFEYIQDHADSFEYFIAIGHGEHVPMKINVLIPHNVFVVYTTAPGYYGNMLDTLDPNFLALITDLNRMKRLIKGTLNPHEIPTLIQGRKWDWRNHIYPPGSFSVEHTLECYDLKRGTAENASRYSVFTEFDNVAGMYHVPNPSRSFHYDRRPPMQNNKYVNTNSRPNVLLSEIVQKASVESGNKYCIVFISGCRGDKRISDEFYKFFMQNPYRINLPQTYTILRTPSNLMGRTSQKEKNTSMSLRLNRFYDENNIQREVRNLPTGSKKLPSNHDIIRFGNKYKIFLRKKGLTANEYIRRVLNHRRVNVMKKFRQTAQEAYARKKQAQKNLRNEIARRIKTKRLTKFTESVKSIMQKRRAKMEKTKKLKNVFTRTKAIHDKQKRFLNFYRRWLRIENTNENSNLLKLLYLYQNVRYATNKSGNKRNVKNIITNKGPQRGITNNNQRVLIGIFNNLKKNE